MAEKLNFFARLKANPAHPSYFRTRVPDYIPSHAQRVKALYKTACRTLEDHPRTLGPIRWCYYYLNHLDPRIEQRFQMRKVRKMFDDNKYVHDPLEARKMLIAGEFRVFNMQHPLIRRFPNSPGGIEYNRYPFCPDWMLDTLTPEEKAEYPEYFARREVRKKEFMDRWLDTYGKDAVKESI